MDVPVFPDWAALLHWGAVRAKNRRMHTCGINPEYAADSMNDYIRRIVKRTDNAEWVAELYAFFWVPVSPRGSLAVIHESQPESDTSDSDGESDSDADDCCNRRNEIQ
jgi:hypothetical protein